jgi:hypothetical protein
MRKRGIIWDSLVPWIIGVAVLVVVVLVIMVLKDRGVAAVDFFNKFRRFGG